MALAEGFALALCALLSACGGKPPEIVVVEWRLERRPSRAGDYESLSVFASIKDDDGIDDVETLWVVNDAEALAWKFTNEDWTKKTEGADDWIGEAGLVRQDYAAMPRGEYRLVAVDAAGERVEKAFSVEGSFPETPAPTPILEKNGLRAASAWPETLLLAYDAAGDLIATAPGNDDAFGLPELFGPDAAARAMEVAAYGYDPALKMGAYSWKRKTR
jgi:hypothetical protein